MKIIRTANLSILQTWLLGGQTEDSGNSCEGFNTFTSEYWDALKANDKFDCKKIKNIIVHLISEFDDYKFNYYRYIYKLKIPSDKNLNILAKRVLRKLEQREANQ